jgi:hypothetical protein
VLILVFIFLTPKSWFKNGERALRCGHQSRVATVLLAPEVVVNESDTGQIANRVKSLTGCDEVEVVGVRRVVASDGTTRGFEVDIR